MDTEKSSGSDQLPVKFYKTLWTVVSSVQMNSWNYSYKTSQVSTTKSGSMIKFLPKKKVAELQYINNWRPITLLNCYYIIAMKALANQLKNVLPNLINNNQTSFTKIGS